MCVLLSARCCCSRVAGEPRVHLGLVASGRCVVSDPQLHQDFASELGVLAFDQEMDAVVESIYGNRKDTYTVIRGIADYRSAASDTLLRIPRIDSIAFAEVFVYHSICLALIISNIENNFLPFDLNM